MKKILLSALLFLSAFAFYAQENNTDIKSENLQTLEAETEKEKLEDIENIASEISNSEKLIKEQKELKPKKDISVLLYGIPGWFGIETDGTPFMKFRQDSENVQTLLNISGEVRGNIATVKNFTFAWAAGIESYSELKTSDSNRFSTLNVSLGFGTYLNQQTNFNFSLDGPYIFFYPLYSMPVLIANNKDNDCIWGQYDQFGYRWKMAAEMGRTFYLASFNWAPYLRCISGWTKEGKYNAALSLGISIGINF